jgi:glycosyltransferase involved in cell wall biosynthesis
MDMPEQVDSSDEQRRLKIFGWAIGQNGCGQYRIGLPMWCLGLAGHDARAFTVLEGDPPEDLDILVGQLIWDEERSAFWQEQARREDRNFGMVFEMDDDIWTVHSSNEMALGYRDPVLQRRFEDNIRVADAVTVTSNHLAEIVSKFNPNVYVIPNCIDFALLSYQKPATERLTVGWAGGSSHKQDFEAVKSGLRSFLKRNPDIDMHFIGQSYAEEVGRPDARFTGWSVNLVEYLQNIDFTIGLAPLAFHRFNRSKSDLKFLEYSALGIPVVASDFGPYAESVIHGVTGFLVSRPHEWSQYLRDLVNDEAMRTEIGINAKTWAATRIIQSNYWRWEAVYRQVLGERSSVDSAALAG